MSLKENGTSSGLKNRDFWGFNSPLDHQNGESKSQPMNKPTHWKLLAFVYRVIRPLFVEDVDPNEDYECCWCVKPVLTRMLFCSRECNDRSDNEMQDIQDARR